MDKVAPAYILFGPETGKKLEWIDALKTTLASPELHKFYPYDATVSDMRSALDNNSLFSDHRLVIIEKMEDLTAEQVTMLTEYLAHPSPTATLVLTTEETSLSSDKKSSKLVSAIPKNQTQVFWELFESDKITWIKDFFKTQGYGITYDAISLLLELVENTTLALKQTGNQLLAYLHGDESKHTITEEDIEQYVSMSREYNRYSLFDPIAEGDLEKTLRIYHSLTGTEDGEPIPLVASLLFQFRKLLSLHHVSRGRTPTEDAFSAITVLGVKQKKLWKREQTLYKKALKYYSEQDVQHIITFLDSFDIQVREASADMVPALMDTCFYRIIIKKGIPANLVRFASFN